MRLTQPLDATTILALSLELSVASWRIAASDGKRSRPSMFKADALEPLARLEEVVMVIKQLLERWLLPAGVRVALIYEAGQDGFWIARALRERGYQVVVCDAASVPKGSHARRAKTDRLDAIMLLENLLGWLRGERSGMRVVRTPSVEEEALRNLARDRGVLQKEVGQHRDRMRKLLRLQGCWVAPQADVCALLKAGELRCWNGEPLPEPLQMRLQAEGERLAAVKKQLDQLERTWLEALPQAVRERVERLQKLAGVGWVGAMRLVLELFWRNFTNRRQVGAAVGLVPQPYDSGEHRQDQGISKASNARVRSLLIEMSWMWQRYQPDSEITKWFEQRTSASGPNRRMRRIAIVAVARRLVIALWRYLTDGVIPAGARLKAG